MYFSIINEKLKIRKNNNFSNFDRMAMNLDFDNKVLFNKLNKYFNNNIKLSL